MFVEDAVDHGVDEASGDRGAAQGAVDDRAEEGVEGRVGIEARGEFAGGDAALLRAKEGAEDELGNAVDLVRRNGISGNDALIAVAKNPAGSYREWLMAQLPGGKPAMGAAWLPSIP